MCHGCYIDYGSPKIISEATRAAADLIECVYDYSFVGGNLHVHLDDWNLDDEFFDHLTKYDEETSPEQWAAEVECFEALKAMSVEERASALALQSNYIQP